MKKTFTTFLESKKFSVSDILMEASEDRIEEKIRKAIVHFKNEADGDVPPEEILELARKFAKTTKNTLEKAMANAVSHKEYISPELAKDAIIVLTIAGETTGDSIDFLKICNSSTEKEKSEWEATYSIKVASDDMVTDKDLDNEASGKSASASDSDEEKDTKGETGEYEDSEGNIVSPLKTKFANKLGDKLLSKEGDVTDKKTAKVIICVATEQDDPEIPRSGVFGYLADPKLSSTKILAIDTAEEAEKLILATETFKTEKDFIRKFRKLKGEDEVKLFIYNTKDETGKPWKVEAK